MNTIPVAWQPLTDAGAIISGAKAYFYRTGTSTPKDTYSVKALTVGQENANPVVADAYGRFGPIFLKKDEGYRVVLKTSADVTVWTKDEVFASALAVDEQTRRKAIVLSPMDHGATGDGVANDATALATALAALSSGGVLDLEGKTYRCDSTLAVTDGIHIKNGSINFFNASISAGLQAAGSAGSNVVFAIATSGSRRYLSVASASGLAAGDLLRIKSSDTIVSGHEYAELFTIESVSGTDVYLNGQPLGTYTTTPLFNEINPISNISFSDLTITAPVGGWGIDLTLCQRVRMSNVTVRTDNSSTGGIRLLSVYDATLDGCSITPYDENEVPIGMAIGDASCHVVLRNCRIERCLLGIEIGNNYGNPDGMTRDVRVVGCELIWCGGISVLDGGNYVTIADCELLCDYAPSGTTYAISLGGLNATVSGCQIRSGSSSKGIVVDTSGAAEVVRIVNNEIYTINSAYIDFVDANIELIEISGNTCWGGGGTGAAIDLTFSTNTCDMLRVCNNSIEAGAATHCISMSGGVNRSVIISGNSMNLVTSASGVACVAVVMSGGIPNTANVTVSGNFAYTQANSAIGVKITGGGPGLLVSANMLQTHGTCLSIVMNGGSRIAISGNVMNMTQASYASGRVIAITGSGSGIAYVSVSGNILDREDDANINTELDDIDGITVSGNVIINGNYGLDIDAGSTEAIHDGNVFTGQGTAETNGTFDTTGDLT